MRRNVAAPMVIRARTPHVNRSAREYKTSPEYHKHAETSPLMPVPTSPIVDGADRILTPSAIAFVEDLTRRFRPRIDELLERRRATQAGFDNGDRPDFLAETAAVPRGDL